MASYHPASSRYRRYRPLVLEIIPQLVTGCRLSLNFNTPVRRMSPKTDKTEAGHKELDYGADFTA